ncbi:hypothetical protein BDK51DRAFT_40748 [Blyttiomyces helicus]|uniref:FHA domain-containing protein n=1 Tax=Blyttiomyces helicus TaxID=388810 RepID=A0A4P9WL29_9FUNG|nr:hypothetical protein BDK51DRAFT_40748 [Blyttiomyces helicus]|eukprot:RKO91326.1 hypothetical protein BDK51DRAFT_40748 [Blyttiomyces helicus]
MTSGQTSAPLASRSPATTRLKSIKPDSPDPARLNSDKGNENENDDEVVEGENEEVNYEFEDDRGEPYDALEEEALLREAEQSREDNAQLGKDQYIQARVRREEPVPRSKRRLMAHLHVIGPKDTQSSLTIPIYTGLNIIGRNPTATVRKLGITGVSLALVDVLGVSNVHALIGADFAYAGGKGDALSGEFRKKVGEDDTLTFVEDLRSTNSTTISGHKLRQGSLYQLVHGSEVCFSPAQCRYEYVNPPQNIMDKVVEASSNPVAKFAAGSRSPTTSAAKLSFASGSSDSLLKSVLLSPHISNPATSRLGNPKPPLLFVEKTSTIAAQSDGGSDAATDAISRLLPKLAPLVKPDSGPRKQTILENEEREEVTGSASDVMDGDEINDKEKKEMEAQRESGARPEEIETRVHPAVAPVQSVAQNPEDRTFEMDETQWHPILMGDTQVAADADAPSTAASSVTAFPKKVVTFEDAAAADPDATDGEDEELDPSASPTVESANLVSQILAPIPAAPESHSWGSADDVMNADEDDDEYVGSSPTLFHAAAVMVHATVDDDHLNPHPDDDRENEVVHARDSLGFAVAATAQDDERRSAPSESQERPPASTVVSSIPNPNPGRRAFLADSDSDPESEPEVDPVTNRPTTHALTAALAPASPSLPQNSAAPTSNSPNKNGAEKRNVVDDGSETEEEDTGEPEKLAPGQNVETPVRKEALWRAKQGLKTSGVLAAASAPGSARTEFTSKEATSTGDQAGADPTSTTEGGPSKSPAVASLLSVSRRRSSVAKDAVASDDEIVEATPDRVPLRKPALKRRPSALGFPDIEKDRDAEISVQAANADEDNESMDEAAANDGAVDFAADVDPKAAPEHVSLAAPAPHAAEAPLRAPLADVPVAAEAVDPAPSKRKAVAQARDAASKRRKSVEGEETTVDDDDVDTKVQADPGSEDEAPQARTGRRKAAPKSAPKVAKASGKPARGRRSVSEVPKAEPEADEQLTRAAAQVKPKASAGNPGAADSVTDEMTKPESKKSARGQRVAAEVDIDPELETAEPKLHPKAGARKPAAEEQVADDATNPASKPHEAVSASKANPKPVAGARGRRKGATVSAEAEVEHDLENADQGEKPTEQKNGDAEKEPATEAPRRNARGKYKAKPREPEPAAAAEVDVIEPAPPDADPDSAAGRRTSARARKPTIVRPGVYHSSDDEPPSTVSKSKKTLGTKAVAATGKSNTPADHSPDAPASDAPPTPAPALPPPSGDAALSRGRKRKSPADPDVIASVDVPLNRGRKRRSAPIEDDEAAAAPYDAAGAPAAVPPTATEPIPQEAEPEDDAAAGIEVVVVNKTRGKGKAPEKAKAKAAGGKAKATGGNAKEEEKGKKIDKEEEEEEQEQEAERDAEAAKSAVEVPGRAKAKPAGKKRELGASAEEPDTGSSRKRRAAAPTDADESDDPLAADNQKMAPISAATDAAIVDVNDTSLPKVLFTGLGEFDERKTVSRHQMIVPVPHRDAPRWHSRNDMARLHAPGYGPDPPNDQVPLCAKRGEAYRRRPVARCVQEG